MKLRFKRWFAILLAVVLALSLIPSMALADTGSSGNTDQLLIKWMEWNNNQWVESNQIQELSTVNLSVDGSWIVRFYSGTTLLEATPQSSNTNIFTVAKCTESSADEKPCYELRGVGFGTATLTCGDYSVPVTVSLPWAGFYSARKRSESNYLSQVTYDKDEDNTFWLMCEEGFTQDQLTNLTLTLDGKTYDGLKAEKTTRTSSADATDTTVRYDVEITLPAELDLRAGEQWLEVQSDCMGMGIKVLIPEQPRLLMMGLEPDPEGNYPLWDFSSCEPGWCTDGHFYYGTTEDNTPVTNVEVTDGDSVVVTPQPDEDNVSYWNFQCANFGTSTLEITATGNNNTEKTYTQKVTVGLPWEGFYSTQNRSKTTYLSQVTYNKTEGNTLWLMRENGFSAEELGFNSSDNSNPLTVTLDDNVLEAASVTPELSNGSTDRYDVKIMLPAGLDLSGGRFWLQVQNSETGNQFRGIEVQQPRLLLRWLEWDEEAQVFYENTVKDLEDLPPYNLGNGFMGCLYYGTPESYVPVTGITVNGSSVAVNVDAEATLDAGKTVWNIQCEAVGESTLTITAGGQAYTQKINVTLPEYGFYTEGTLDGAHFVSNCEYNDLPADKTLWLMCADGFTQTQLDNLTVTLNDNAITATAVPRDPNAETVVYDVKVTLPEMEPSNPRFGLQAMLEESWGAWYIAHCEITVRGAAAYAGGYVEGFYFYIADDVPCFTEGDGNYGNSHGADEYTGEYVQFQEDMKIGAAEKQFDAQGGAYYTLVGSDQVQITVNKVWIESVCGEAGTFSLSQTAAVSERSDLGTSLQFPLYYKPGREEGVLIHAELSITVNGETEPIIADVSQYCFADVRVMETSNRPAGDTVTDLNNYLKDLYNRRVAKGIYTINLADTIYTGTIEIPVGFEEKDGQEVELILAGAEAGNTVIQGGIDLNKNYLGNLENITFDGNKSTASALYNGSCLNMFGCTFKGYTGAAVDGSSGMMTLSEHNVFLDNNIAVKIDADSWKDWSSNLRPWLNNTFINNGTAVQILSLNDAVSSHNLRLYDSDFIGNGTDFDARCGGTLYFYRNYFGSFDSGAADPVTAFSQAKALNDFTGLLTSKRAAIYTENNTTVIVNPRWKYPVKNLGNPPEYRNYLISDWTLPTQILNTEASNLKLDASAFEEEGTKTITVVDEQDQPVGTWIFD